MKQVEKISIDAVRNTLPKYIFMQEEYKLSVLCYNFIYIYIVNIVIVIVCFFFFFFFFSDGLYS